MLQLGLIDEESILTKIKSGSEQAFKSLFDIYFIELYHYAYKYIKDKELAEDIVHDVFLMVWQKRDSLDIHSSLKSYLYTCVRNRSLDQIKTLSKTAFDKEESILQVANHNTPYQELAFDELSLIMKNAIENLPKSCRSIFLMSRDGEMTYKEIAAELNLSIKTVETQMGIGLKKIREYLSIHWDSTLLLFFLIFSQIFRGN